MRMEGRTPMVPRQNLGTERRGTQNESCTKKPRRPLIRTWGNSKNYRAGQQTILLARIERNNQMIRQEQRYLPTEQSGPTRTLRNAITKQGTRSTMEIDCHGLHYGPSNLWRIWHDSGGHWPPDKNESFHSLQQKPGQTAVRNLVPQRNHTTTRHTQRRHYR